MDAHAISAMEHGRIQTLAIVNISINHRRHVAYVESCIV